MTWLLPLALAACTSTSLEDAMPAAATPAPVAAAATQPVVVPAEVGESPDGTLPQISTEERDALLARIDAARAGQGTAGRSQIELGPEDLRVLARRHGDAALVEIEGE